MKMNSFGLLALSAIAMSLPMAASAAVSATVTVNGALDGGFAGTPKTHTIAAPLADLDVVSVSVKGVGAGSYVYDTIFQVAQDSFLAGSSFALKSSAHNATLLGGSVVGGWNGATNQYEFTGLKAGVSYTWETTATITTNNGSLGSQFSVAAVPEPEEWAMMLVGAGLVSYQVRRKQKGLRQSVLA